MYQYKGKIINVVDGDTVDALVDVGFDVSITLRFRLAHINTPERGQPGYQEAADFIKEWVSKHPVCTIDTLKDRREKYGRYLAVVDALPAEFQTLNELLVAKKLAVAYEGGARPDISIP